MPTEKQFANRLTNRHQGVVVHHLHQIELADRWRISPRTLERWRWLQQGPAYLKIGGRVAYRLEDVEAYEAAQWRDGSVASHPDLGRAG
jgi:hypothetical protein